MAERSIGKAFELAFKLMASAQDEQSVTPGELISSDREMHALHATCLHCARRGLDIIIVSTTASEHAIFAVSSLGVALRTG